MTKIADFTPKPDLEKMLRDVQFEEKQLPDLKEAAEAAAREYSRAQTDCANKWNAFHKALMAHEGAIKQSDFFPKKQYPVETD